MQIYGFLEKAQLENVSSDLANTLAGLLWFNTTDSAFRFYDGSAVRTAVDTNSAQTLTGKILTGNTLGSFSPDGVETITVPVATDTMALLAAAQTLTNKIINGGVYDYLEFVQQATPSTPAAGRNRLYFKNDGQLYRLDEEGNEAPVGSGSGGGLDVFLAEDFVINSASDFATGNSATFLGGGTLDGVLSDETAAPIAGVRSMKYTAGAASLNDYIASPIKDLDRKQRGQTIGIKIPHLFDEAINVEVVIYDVTNGAKLNASTDVITDSNGIKFYTNSVFIPETCTQIRYGFHFLEAISNGTILEFNDIELSTDPFVYKNLMVDQSSRWDGFSGHGSTATKIPYFTTEVDVRGGGVFEVTNDSTNGMQIKALRKCTISAQFIARQSGNNQVGFSFDNSQFNPSLTTDIGSLAPASGGLGFNNLGTGTFVNFSTTVNMEAGDILRPHTNGVINTFAQIHIAGQAQSEHVVTPAKSGIENYQATSAAGYASGKKVIYYNTEVENTISKTGVVTNDATDGLTFTATKKVLFFGHGSVAKSGGVDVRSGWVKNPSNDNNDVSVEGLNVIGSYTQMQSGDSSWGNSGGVGILEPGDVVKWMGSGNALSSGNGVGVSFAVVDFNQQILSAIPKNRHTKRILSTNIGTTVDIPELRLGNIIPGRIYKIMANVHFGNVNSGGVDVFTIKHNGQTKADVSFDGISGAASSARTPAVAIFEAETDTITFDFTQGRTTLRGNGTEAQTWVHVIELNQDEISDAFVP